MDIRNSDFEMEPDPKTGKAATVQGSITQCGFTRQVGSADPESGIARRTGEPEH